MSKLAVGFVLVTGEIALISPEDAWLLRMSWGLWRRPNGGAYVRRKGATRAVAAFSSIPKLLHRAIMQPEPGQIVDHINGDTLDNRRENLRIATASQNARNIGSNRKNAGSPYVGVGWHSGRGKWTSSIRVDGKLHYLGIFEDIDDARRARAAAEMKLWGIEPRREAELRNAR